MEIKNSVALVTGANRGLGKVFTETLLKAGATRVYAGARHPASITLSDSRVVSIALDVTQENSVVAAAKNCADVTLLINNAGIMKGSPMLAEGSEAALRDEMEVNVFGVLRMVRAFAPLLAKNGGGAIANILSVVSWYVYPFNATYCASKHAALALTEAVRIQLKAQRTQVVAVYAGFIDTDMAAGFDHAAGVPKTSPQQVAERTLQGIMAGTDQVHADTRAEEMWRALKTDSGQIAQQMQQLWDASAAKR